MVDVKEAKRILWADAESMTDEEIQRVIDLLRWVCRFVIDEYYNAKCTAITEDTENEKED